MAKENEQKAAELAQENESLKARESLILDSLVELQAQVDLLKAAQVGQSAVTVKKKTIEDELDAEFQALKAEFGDLPNIGVIERRVLQGLDADSGIRLKDEPPPHEDPTGAKRTWWLRWFNMDANDNRGQQAIDEGYVKVRWDQLQNQEIFATLERKDEYVRKGQRGAEILYAMPLKLYRYKKKRDTMLRNANMQSESAMRNMLAGQAASMAGKTEGMNADQAGSFVANGKAGGMSLTIQPQATEHVGVKF